MTAPQYPAGEYLAPEELTADQRTELIERLATAPARAREAVCGLSEDQLDTKYRNWTIRQIIHHLADSHINCYVRFRWALTEDSPKIKSYDETQWSEIVDARTIPVDASLQILEGLHSRWCQLLALLTDEEFETGFFHPEMDRVVTLIEALPSYVWHTDHHLAQIAWLRSKHGW